MVRGLRRFELKGFELRSANCELRVASCELRITLRARCSDWVHFFATAEGSRTSMVLWSRTRSS